ncbi:MAG: hypothetical protein R3C19_22350 [Planctomycetaceae bacterium]
MRFETRFFRLTLAATAVLWSCGCSDSGTAPSKNLPAADSTPGDSAASDLGTPADAPGSAAGDVPKPDDAPVEITLPGLDVNASGSDNQGDDVETPDEPSPDQN